MVLSCSISRSHWRHRHHFHCHPGARCTMRCVCVFWTFLEYSLHIPGSQLGFDLAFETAVRRYSMELVSSEGFPDGVSNHEAIDIKSEDECKKSCLRNWQTCVALSWLGSRMQNEPCSHYQNLRSSNVRPLKGCNYWKVVHPNASGDATSAIGLNLDQSQPQSLLVE